MDRTRRRVVVTIGCVLLLVGLAAVGAGRMQQAHTSDRLAAIAAAEASDVQSELDRLVEFGTAVALAVRERPVSDQAGFDELVEALGLQARFTSVEVIALLEPVARDELVAWWAEHDHASAPSVVQRDTGEAELLLVRHAYPPDRALLLRDVDLTGLEATHAAARRTMATGTPHLSQAAELVVLGPDDPGASLHVPLTEPDGTMRGTIAVGLSGPSLLDALLPLPGAVHVTIREPTSQRYPLVADVGPEPLEGRGAAVATASIGLPSPDWVIEVRPAAGFTPFAGRWIVELLLGAGVLLAALAGLAVYALASREQAANDLAVVRTRELAAANRDLEVANERLRHADAMKDRFLAAVSHELRTPLTVIAGLAETLRRLPPDVASPAELLDPLDRNVRRLDALVGDVLLLAGIDARAVTPRPVPIDLGWELQRLLAVHGPHDEFGLEIDPDLVVTCDPRHLERIVGSLLDNALRHGAPPFEVLARREGPQVLLVVRDHGPGLGDEPLAALTERFARGQGADLSSGTGLGLALVRELVEHAGGQLRAEEADPGARFLVLLPAGRLSPRRADPSEPAERSDQAGTGSPAAFSTGPPAGS